MLQEIHQRCKKYTNMDYTSTATKPSETKVERAKSMPRTSISPPHQDLANPKNVHVRIRMLSPLAVGASYFSTLCAELT